MNRLTQNSNRRTVAIPCRQICAECDQLFFNRHDNSWQRAVVQEVLSNTSPVQPHEDSADDRAGLQDRRRLELGGHNAGTEMKQAWSVCQRSRDMISLQFSIQSGSLDSQDLSGLGLIPTGVFQGFQDMFLFNIGH